MAPSLCVSGNTASPYNRRLLPVRRPVRRAPPFLLRPEADPCLSTSCSLEIGLVFSLVALGVFITFRVLNFPDLTVDGSFPLGGAVAATLISRGHDPFLATAIATAATSSHWGTFWEKATLMEIIVSDLAAFWPIVSKVS